MGRRYYNASTLERDLLAFEDRYSMTSLAFYEAHKRGKVPESVSPFDRVVWSDTYGEHRRLVAAAAATRRTTRRTRAALQPAG